MDETKRPANGRQVSGPLVRQYLISFSRPAQRNIISRTGRISKRMKNSEQSAGCVAEISNGSDTSDSKTPPEGRVEDNSMCPRLPIAPR
ncbi:unnamed protein product [Macrosiphum euphorbiae]|uniref:Uncharacterized protein n=1 Tax=Macrosiphum euphorbiae TaxID=13131 RepID=A0AAV0WU53_9HEMI|nr:unnamed protein product [Macrosiphum euphorbiae]